MLEELKWKREAASTRVNISINMYIHFILSQPTCHAMFRKDSILIGKSKGGWGTGFNFKGKPIVLERETILRFLPFRIAKTWFYIRQPFSCYNVFSNITIKLFRFKTAK